jgi:O-acetylhomoserine/O-acetylserine sulfhydrylase-like pyridoxal-dependent enzyme
MSADDRHDDRHPETRTVHHTVPQPTGGAGGGDLAFDLAGGRPAGRTLVESVRLASLSPSLGDVRTLVMHPANTSHRQDGLTGAT